MRQSISLTLLLISTASLWGGVRPESYLADTSTELNKTYPDNRIINIVCHGHSVPAGFFKTPKVDSLNAYPHLLHRALKAQFPHAVVNVIVTAIGGESSPAGAQRFEQDVLTHNPDVITIDYALNDQRVGLEAAKAAWDSMIKAAQARGVEVVLLTPTGDTRADLDDANDSLNQHAVQIRALAKEHDVALADSLGAWKAHIADGGELTDLISQVNHPNRAGHDLVVAELIKWFPE
jgi:acyl-CoA thioesterase-1